MKIVLLTSLLAFAGPAFAADDATLRRCRALADDALRLTCYDALASVSGAATLAVPVAPAAQPVLPAETFGLDRRAGEVDEIKSRIAGVFEGWGPRTQIRLANGQVWQVVDDSSGVYTLRDPLVTVRRAAMGSFVLEIDGARRAPRVRRVE